MNLTNAINWDYPIAQVLETPKQSGTPRPKVVVFLRPLFLSMVGRARNRIRESGITPPDFARFLAPGHQYVAGCQLPRKEQRTMANLTILSREIRRLDGLYSLNDLHKASGSKPSHKPANWLRNQQAIDLIELLKSEQLTPIISKQGLGTFVCRELVFAYAMWISPEFNLHVIRAFDRMQQKAALPDCRQNRQTYNYPRRLLEQPGFMSGSNPADLCPLMLSKTESFVSPLFGLLNELRADGHDVSAPWDEAIAMREGLIQMTETLEEIYLKAIRSCNKSASTRLKGGGS